jgi:hypothetical protein
LRAYLVALGLTTLILGLPLLLAGEVRIGCTVTDQGSNTIYSNCGGADELELAGAVLIVAAACLLLGSLVPNEQSRYK